MCKLYSLSLLFLLWTISPAQAQELKLPAEITAGAGELVEIKASGEGVVGVTWYVPDAGLSIIPKGKLKDPLTTYVVAVKPGKYRIVATGFGEFGATDPVIVLVVVSGSGPVVPPETDPLLGKVTDAYKADASADKSKHLASLTSLYKLAGPYCSKPEIATVGKLFSTIKDAGTTLVPGNSLMAIRRLFAEELAKTLGDDEAATLTPELRAKAAEQFARFEALLRAIK